VILLCNKPKDCVKYEQQVDAQFDPIIRRVEQQDGPQQRR
jgi:hypothetical protein